MKKSVTTPVTTVTTPATARLVVELPITLKDRFGSVCRKQRLSQAETVRSLIKDYIAEAKFTAAQAKKAAAQIG